MPEDIPTPTPTPGGAPPALPPAARPRVPGWMWATFGLGLIPVGAIFGAVSVASQPNQMGVAAVFGGILGLILGLPMVGGLALAARFCSETSARFILGVMFAFLLVVALGGVCFAGCLCMIGK